MEEKEKRLLNGAKFTLYQAKTDENGEILYQDGIPQYQEDQEICSWVSDDATDYTENINLKDYANTSGKNELTGFTLEFARMYEAYGVEGTGFSWSVERRAKRASSASNVWLLEDGARIVTGEDTVVFPETMGREDREGFKAAYEEMAGEKLELKWAVSRRAKVDEIRTVDAKDGQKYPAVQNHHSH